MKKTMMVLLFASVTTMSFGQQNEILSDASKWFKDVYVRENFKDPYSYKELKITLDSMSQGEYLMRTTSTQEISMYRKYATEYKEKYDNEFKKISPIQSFLKLYKDNFDDYSKKVEIMTADSIKFMSMNDFEKNKIKHYIIRIECHANNSYGGQVFGKYSMLYTKEKGFYSVYKTNRE
jgi:hypothetical protein